MLCDKIDSEDHGLVETVDHKEFVSQLSIVDSDVELNLSVNSQWLTVCCFEDRGCSISDQSHVRCF